MATIAGYALVKGIRLHENIGPIYRRILAASQGELSLDEVLFKDELSDCLYHCNLHTASELMDMKQSTKDFEKALKPPPKWWLSLAPGLSGATGLHPNYARALDIARCNPVRCVCQVLILSTDDVYTGLCTAKRRRYARSASDARGHFRCP